MTITAFSLYEADNLVPFAPHGAGGVLKGSVAAFFGFLGFDEVIGRCFSAFWSGGSDWLAPSSSNFHEMIRSHRRRSSALYIYIYMYVSATLAVFFVGACCFVTQCNIRRHFDCCVGYLSLVVVGARYTGCP